jgi:hypothetical protein
MILDNPEFVRLVRSKLRPQRMMMFALIGAFICGGILTLMYLAETGWGRYSLPNATALFHTYFFWITGIQLGVVSLMGLVLSAQNVAMERERSTLDFQRLVGMGPWRLAAGKLFGAPIEALFLAAVGTIFAGFSVMGGGISLNYFVQSQVVIFVFAILVSAFGLLCSSVVEKTSNASGLCVLISICYVIATMMYAARGATSIVSASSPVMFLVSIYQTSLKYQNAGRFSMSFDCFGIAVPILAGFCVVNLLLAWTFFVVTARRLASDEFSYISVRHAAISFVLIQIVLLSDVIGGLGAMRFVAFHAINAILLVALAFGLSPNAELFRGRLYRAQKDDHWRVTLELNNRLQDASPIAAILLFCAAYAVIGFAVAYVAHPPESADFAVILMNCGLGVATASMLVYLHAYLEKGSFKVAVGVLIAALAVPPLMIGVSVSAEHTVMVSPVAYIARMSEFSGAHGLLADALWCCPLIFSALAITSFILVAMRLRYLLDMQALELAAQRKADAAAAPGTAAARLIATQFSASDVATPVTKVD